MLLSQWSLTYLSIRASMRRPVSKRSESNAFLKKRAVVPGGAVATWEFVSLDA